MAGRVDLEEQERRQRTAEFLAAERERYEYLLACASDAEHEELAWETIVARITVEDFVRAAAEVLAGREVIDAAREFLDVLESDREVPALRASRLARLIDIAKAKRVDPAAGHADPEGLP